MRQLNLTGRLASEEPESSRSGHPNHASPTPAGVFPSLIFWGAVVAAVYTLAQPLIRIDPQQLGIASTLPGSRTSDTSVVINGAVGGNLVADGVKTIRLRVNDSDRLVSINNQRFSTRVPLVRGRNMIQAFVGNLASKPIRIMADLPRYDIWIEISWEGVGDVDLHLLTPGGESVNYTHRQSSTGAILDFDNTTADGPEHILMERAVPGSYRLSVNYFSTRGRDPSPIRYRITVKLADGRTVRSFDRVLSLQGETQLVDTFTF